MHQNGEASHHLNGPPSAGAARIFLNVGGRPFVPKMPGVDRVPYLTNVSRMDVEFVPEHLLVVGGSYVGLEFGQMYRRFGSRVTIVEMGPRLIGREDAAALLGVGADEAVHSLIDAVYARTPYSEFQKHVRIHPNVSELLPTVLEDLRPLE